MSVLLLLRCGDMQLRALRWLAVTYRPFYNHSCETPGNIYSIKTLSDEDAVTDLELHIH
jgi:hypothetical protein